MCGLFGIAGTAPAELDPGANARLTWALGLASQERGVHGAGVACLFTSSATPEVTPTDPAAVANLSTSRLRIVKTTGAFETMPSATPPGNSAGFLKAGVDRANRGISSL
ncbi:MULTISPECIES: hypothetical protein [unclassified Frankia]|uniref:hypothetical protein n=1 Tax=unclassified Frankia TaxID=2632575 RepID=UPI002024BE1C